MITSFPTKTLQALTLIRPDAERLVRREKDGRGSQQNQVHFPHQPPPLTTLPTSTTSNQPTTPSEKSHTQHRQPWTRPRATTRSTTVCEPQSCSHRRVTTHCVRRTSPALILATGRPSSPSLMKSLFQALSLRLRWLWRGCVSRGRGGGRSSNAWWSTSQD